MIAFALALLTALHSYAGDVLFVDLNDSAKEIEACKGGMASADPNDQITVCSPNDPEFKAANTDPKTGQPLADKVRAESIERLIAAKERQGRKFDTIIISGHDGSGHFSGRRQGNYVLSTEMAEIVSRHNLKTSVTGMALWGCYTATANACENMWMNKISPSIKATVGFSLQGPDNKQPANWDMLSKYCNTRAKIAAASTEAEMADSLYGLSQVNRNLSICYKNGVCSYDYNNVGQSNAACLHTYQELYRRCQKFDPSKKLLDLFKAYFNAEDPRYMNPPPDGDHAFNSRGKGELRRYYNQLHLWYHCAGLLQKETGYEMPAPEQVLRLTKFDTLKANFARIHARQIAQYNARLEALGMGNLKIDPATMYRSDLVARTQEAVSQFDKLTYDDGNKTVNGVSPWMMLEMAKGFDSTLRNLENDCVPFSYVLEGSEDKSDCIADYGRFPKWPPRQQ